MQARKIIISSIILSLLSSFSFAQALRDFNSQSPPTLSNRIWLGGNLGLQFGSQTFVQVAPMVGYRLTEKLTAGVTGNYIYFKDNIIDYSSEIYGGGVFGRYFVTDDLYLHSEYEVLNLDIPNVYGSGYTRSNVTSVLVGGGYRQWISERAGLDLMILFNLNQSRYSPYNNPIIRFGFVFGI